MRSLQASSASLSDERLFGVLEQYERETEEYMQIVWVGSPRLRDNLKLFIWS